MANLYIDPDEEYTAIANVSLSSGIISPIPETGGGTVRSATVSLVNAGTLDMHTKAGKYAMAILEGDRDYLMPEELTARYNESTVYAGKVSSVDRSSSSDLVSLSIDNDTAALNQEIRTWPIIGEYGDPLAMSVFLVHLYAQCGIYHMNPGGLSHINITDTLYGNGAIRDQTKTLVGLNAGHTTTWQIPEASGGSVAIPFTVGTALNLQATIASTANTGVSSGFPDNFWKVFLNANMAVGGDTFTTGSLRIGYNATSRVLMIAEYLSGQVTKTVKTLTLGAITGRKLILVDLLVSRTTSTTVTYDYKVSVEGEQYLIGSVAVPNSYLANNVLTITGVQNTHEVASENNFSQGYMQAFSLASGATRYNNSLHPYGAAYEHPFPTASTYHSRNFKLENVGNDRRLVFPVLTGTGWSILQQFAEGFGVVVVPHLLDASITPTDQVYNAASDEQHTLRSDARELAETVIVQNYDYESADHVGEILELWRADSTYSVGKGERQEHIIQLEASPTQIYQPVVGTPDEVIKAMKGGTNTKSIYSVFGADNTGVNSNEWNNSGGSVSVEYTENPNEIKLVIQGPHEVMTKAAPYTISLEGTIPAFVLAGTGLKPRKKAITIYTGAGPVAKKLGTDYDNPLVGDSWLAYGAGNRLGQVYGTPSVAMSGSFVAEHDPESVVVDLNYKINYNRSNYQLVRFNVNDNHLSYDSAIKWNTCDDVKEAYVGMTWDSLKTLFAGKDWSYFSYAPLPQKDLI